VECDGTPWKAMELLEHSMGFLYTAIYNKLTCTSKGERPPLTFGHYHLKRDPSLAEESYPLPYPQDPHCSVWPLLPKLGVHRKILKIADYLEAASRQQHSGKRQARLNREQTRSDRTTLWDSEKRMMN